MIPTHHLRWREATDEQESSEPCANMASHNGQQHYVLHQWWHEPGNFDNGEWRPVPIDYTDSDTPPTGD